MLSLTDQQLKTVADAARDVPQEKRDVYLQRIAAMLTIRGRGHFNDADVAEVAALGGVRTDATPLGIIFIIFRCIRGIEKA